tara:strand:+ start:266 stop:1063 length:798 start_codon:yes stop_codon:yes gene_type:complete
MDNRSIYLRKLILRALKGGGRGHIGSSMSLVEILRVLYDDVLYFDHKKPEKKNRDRLILSKGHGCLALYAILCDKKFIKHEELDNFCKFNSILGGHPEKNKIPGVEYSTGSLGHGPGVGIGISLALKRNKINSNTYVIVGDGEINEGSCWEAFLTAKKHNLDNYIIIVDYNKIQSAGFTKDILDLEPLTKKFNAFNFDTYNIDGHNLKILKKTFNKFKKNKKPKAVICNTIKGKGINFAENNPNWHHLSKIDNETITQLEKALNK